MPAHGVAEGGVHVLLADFGFHVVGGGLDPSGPMGGALVSHGCVPRAQTNPEFWSFVAKQLFRRYSTSEAEFGRAVLAVERQAHEATTSPESGFEQDNVGGDCRMKTLRIGRWEVEVDADAL